MQSASYISGRRAGKNHETAEAAFNPRRSHRPWRRETSPQARTSGYAHKPRTHCPKPSLTQLGGFKEDRQFVEVVGGCRRTKNNQKRSVEIQNKTTDPSAYEAKAYPLDAPSSAPHAAMRRDEEPEVITKAQTTKMATKRAAGKQVANIRTTLHTLVRLADASPTAMRTQT